MGNNRCSFVCFPCPITITMSCSSDSASDQLIVAAKDGNTAQVLQLLLHPPSALNVNQQDELHLTALHYAARNGHELIARILCENGAELPPKNVRVTLTPTLYTTPTPTIQHHNLQHRFQ
jgi:ankyrin repeat protein